MTTFTHEVDSYRTTTSKTAVAMGCDCVACVILPVHKHYNTAIVSRALSRCGAVVQLRLQLRATVCDHINIKLYGAGPDITM